MSGIRCPRCSREAPELTAFCAGCGAPLLLPDEPAARPLDGSLELDRRGRAAGRDERTRAGARPPPVHGPKATSTPPPPSRAPTAARPKTTPTPPPLSRAPTAARPKATPPPPPLPRAPTAARPKAQPPPEPPHPPAAPPPPATPRAGELAAMERSSWDIGAGAHAAAPEPAVARAEPAAPRPEAPPDPLPDAEVDTLEVHLVHAESWRRVGAWLVDALPFAAGGVALAARLAREAGPGRQGAPLEVDALLDLLVRERVIVLSVGAAAVLCLAVYATLAHALAGATLGKRLFGIRVVGPDGARPSPARSAVRTTLALLSAGLLGLGFLLALFTRTGRAFHDLVARTWVVKAP